MRFYRLRRWLLELQAVYYGDLAFDYQRLRNRTLDKLRALERRRRDAETQREIGDILARRGPAPTSAANDRAIEAAARRFGAKPAALCPLHLVKDDLQ